MRKLRIVLFTLGAFGLASTAPAFAAEADAPPTKLEFEFGVDAVAAGFFNSNPYFGNDVVFLGGEVDQWLELGIEPKISFQGPLGRGVLFGQLSGVWTYTEGNDASGLNIGVQDASEVTVEQANVGWRANDLFAGLEGDELSVSIGSQDYKIGSGLLIADGTSDGGERGGWYLSMRKSFQESILVRLKTDDFLFEGFKLANRPRMGGNQGDAVGMNFELPFAKASRAGFTVMSVDPNTGAPVSEEATVVSGRYDLTPESGFGFNAEYVKETSEVLDADGMFATLSFTPANMGWSPTFSYRFATFSGDDPATAIDERFREIAYGFHDYGSWFQGEITGNYPLGNGNLQSNLLRAKLAPGKDLTLNVLYYQFTFNEPASFGVVSDDWGDEINVALDWAYSDKLYLIGVFGMLMPGDGALQFTGGTGDDNWTYVMVYASYAF
jgi:hypothetical protein